MYKKTFKQKLTSSLLVFLLMFQTVIGVFAPLNFSVEAPFIESQEASAAASWYGTAGWGYRKKITIDHDKVANSNQTNFPVLINRIDEDWRTVANNGKVGQDDGGDFLFTSSDGQTKLSHEIEKYTITTGELVAWVKIPTLSYSADTEIYLYYGNASCADQWDASGGTWDSNFKLVQHLQEDPSTGAPQMIDSTNLSNDGTSAGTMLTEDQAAGQIDGSLEFDGTDDYVAVADVASLDFGTSDFTISAWVYSNGYFNQGSAWNSIVSKGALSGTPTEFYGFFIDSSNKINFVIIDDNYNIIGPDISNGWHHLVGYRSGNNTYLYVDGAYIGTSVVSGSVGGVDSFYVGRDGGLVRPFNGSIDEVRISSTARSADWIATEYNNQSDPSNFYDLGIEDTLNMDHLIITGSTSQTAGTEQTVTITAKDSGGTTITAYEGDKIITFSGATNAPDGTVPTASDKDSADINFTNSTTITFTNGVATSSMKLYKNENAEIEVDDGLYNSDGVDNDLNVAVAGAVLDNFTVEAPANANSGTTFSTTITSRDEFNNTTKIVSGNTTLAVNTGSLDPTNPMILAQGEFTDDGIWTGNLTITDITEQPAVTLSATNGIPTGNDSISVLGIPNDPTGCGASRVSDTNFTVSWSDNSTVETGYRIERSADDGAWTQIVEYTVGSPGDNNSYSDTTTSADHKYEYRVWGYNTSVGDSAGNSTDATEHYTTPDTPSGVAGAWISDGEFTITYTDNAAVEDTHRIERCSNANCDGTYETNLGTFESSPQTDITNLAVNSRYRWRSRSETPDALYSNYGTSNYNYTTPTAPTIGTPGFVDDTHITVNWTDNSDYEDGFRVWVSIDDGVYAEVTAGVNTVGAGIETYSYTSSANHSYKFKITAHTPEGLVSADSAESETVYTTPSVPTIGTPVWVSDNDITVNWTDNSNHEDGFRVWVSEDSGAYTEATAGVNSTASDIQTYSYTSCSFSHNYKFKVQSHLVNNDLTELTNMSGESDTVYTTTDAPTIGTPTADSSTEITWNWTDTSSDEESFRLDFTLGGGTDVEDIASNTETYQTTGLNPNIRYSAHIHSYRADRGESSPSADATIYTLANIPTGLSLTSDSQNQITANYTANSNSAITEYYVENVTAGTNSGWRTSLSWASTSLSCGQEYTFKVKARNGDEVETVFTDTVSIQTQNCGNSLPPSAGNPPSAPAQSDDNSDGEFSVLINNGDEYTNSETVSLKLTAGADTERMAISNNPEFTGASQVAYEENTSWKISNIQYLISNFVYVKFYTKYGVASEVVSDSIILDMVAPIVEATNIEEEYNESEEIIISGITEPNATIAPRLNNEYFSFGTIKANNS